MGAIIITIISCIVSFTVGYFIGYCDGVRYWIMIESTFLLVGVFIGYYACLVLHKDK